MDQAVEDAPRSPTRRVDASMAAKDTRATAWTCKLALFLSLVLQIINLLFCNMRFVCYSKCNTTLCLIFKKLQNGPVSFILRK